MTHRIACLWLVAAIASACADEPTRPAPAESSASEPPARRDPPPQPEPPPPRPRVVPLETAADLRSALRGASGSLPALWTLVDPSRGLDVYVAEEDGAVYLCSLEEGLRRQGFPYVLDSGDSFRCDEGRTRCTAVDSAGGSGTSFHFEPGDGERPRRLAAIVRYGGQRVPAEDRGPVATFVAARGTVCRLRAAIAAAKTTPPAEADMPGELWLYRHPLQGADDDTPEGAPEERHLCGAEARRAAAALVRELAALREAVGCRHAPLSCTYSAPFAERTLFARVDAAGRVVPWAVADLSSLPTAEDAAREDRDVAAFLRRAQASPCP